MNPNRKPPTFSFSFSAKQSTATIELIVLPHTDDSLNEVWVGGNTKDPLKEIHNYNLGMYDDQNKPKSSYDYEPKNVNDPYGVLKSNQEMDHYDQSTT